MKVKLWYLLALMCCLNFTACKDKEDDDSSSSSTDWINYLGTFGGEKYLLVYNEEDITDGSILVILEESGESKEKDRRAKITVKHALWEEDEFSIDNFKLTKVKKTYTFQVSIDILESTYSISGVLTPETDKEERFLTIDLVRKINSNMTGKWELTYENGLPLFDFSADALTEPQSAVLSGMVAQMLAEKVDLVRLYFNEDGTFDFDWKPAGTNTYLTLAQAGPVGAALADVLQFEYYIEKDVIHIGLEGEIVDALRKLLSGFDAAKDYLSLLDLLEYKNGYYSFPVTFDRGLDSTRFYLEKEAIEPVYKVISVLFAEQLNAIEIQGMGPLGTVLNSIINSSKEVEVGLTFN